MDGSGTPEGEGRREFRALFDFLVKSRDMARAISVVPATNDRPNTLTFDDIEKALSSLERLIVSLGGTEAVAETETYGEMKATVSLLKTDDLLPQRNS